MDYEDDDSETEKEYVLSDKEEKIPLTSLDRQEGTKVTHAVGSFLGSKLVSSWTDRSPPQRWIDVIEPPMLWRGSGLVHETTLYSSK